VKGGEIMNGQAMGATQEVTNKISKEEEALYKTLRTPWKELKTDDKVERCRINIKNLQGVVSSLQDMIDALWDHGHDENGKMVIIIKKEELWKFRQGSNSINKAALSGLMGGAEEMF
jgi:hypothetical protein